MTMHPGTPEPPRSAFDTALHDAAQRVHGNAIAQTNTFAVQHSELLARARKELAAADMNKADIEALAERHRQAARAARSPFAFDALGAVAGAVLAALSRPESLRPLIAGVALVTLFCIYLQL